MLASSGSSLSSPDVGVMVRRRLLRSGAAVGVDAALAAVQASRPRAKLNARQRRAVDAWWAAERGGKKAE